MIEGEDDEKRRGGGGVTDSPGPPLATPLVTTSLLFLLQNITQYCEICHIFAVPTTMEISRPLFSRALTPCPPQVSSPSLMASASL